MNLSNNYLCSKKFSAIWRSELTVIFKFRTSPSTKSIVPPANSTNEASSEALSDVEWALSYNVALNACGVWIATTSLRSICSPLIERNESAIGTTGTTASDPSWIFSTTDLNNFSDARGLTPSWTIKMSQFWGTCSRPFLTDLLLVEPPTTTSLTFSTFWSETFAYSRSSSVVTTTIPSYTLCSDRV